MTAKALLNAQFVLKHFNMEIKYASRLIQNVPMHFILPVWKHGFCVMTRAPVAEEITYVQKRKEAKPCILSRKGIRNLKCF